MKLYIDMIAFYLQKTGGVTSVWTELITRMLRDKKEIILILQDTECDNIYYNQIMALTPNVIYESRTNIKINRYMPVKCELENDSNFISTYYRVAKKSIVKQCTIVHDFTYEYYVKGIRRWVHSMQKVMSVKHSDTVICVSKNTMKDLVRFYPWAKNKKCYVIYNGVSEEYKKIDEIQSVKELREYDTKDFLLYVGSRAKYKRFDFAIEVAQHFGYSLVIIGGGELDNQEKRLLESKLEKRYIHINGIDNNTLNKIYNKAFALIYPSEYEGFGIPIIEAQRAECPVIAQKGSSIDEVFENPEYLMQDNNLPEAKRIISMLKIKEKRMEICNKGYLNSKRFDWERTYQEWCNIIF